MIHPYTSYHKMSKLYSVFVRIIETTEDDSYYSAEKETLVGTFNSRLLAEEALPQIDLTEYIEDTNDIWPFCFIVEHELNVPLASTEVKKIGDQISAIKQKEFEASPAVLAYYERINREDIEKKAQLELCKQEKLRDPEAYKRRIQESFNAILRVDRDRVPWESISEQL